MNKCEYSYLRGTTLLFQNLEKKYIISRICMGILQFPHLIFNK